MNVRELREVLKGVSGDTKIIVRAIDDSGYSICADLVEAAIDVAHDDEGTLFLALDADRESK